MECPRECSRLGALNEPESERRATPRSAIVPGTLTALAKSLGKSDGNSDISMGWVL